jgi:muramoyltetrapeptide carboxypeptidase LdcA involved in peptidoglycan recycling
MTVSELIATLQTMPQDAMVVVRGYEDGLDEANTVKECDILTDFHDKWYYGKHSDITDLLCGYVQEEVSPGYYSVLRTSPLVDEENKTTYHNLAKAVYIHYSE